MSLLWRQIKRSLWVSTLTVHLITEKREHLREKAGSPMILTSRLMSLRSICNDLAGYHAIYWFFTEDDKLSVEIKKRIETETDVYVSIVSFWEMAIKSSIGKMELPAPISVMIDECEKMGFEVIPIAAAHLERLKDLPKIHGDPFDRLLICQAQEEGLEFITKDENIPKYDVKTLWG